MSDPIAGADAVDLVVIGDGPAGSALAQACAAAGVDVALVGADDPWDATYGVWADELATVDLLRGHDVLASQHSDIVAWTNQRHEFDRTYGVIDNDALRSILRSGLRHVVVKVERVDVGAERHRVRLDTGATLECRVVVDAAGWPARFAAMKGGARSPAWQTAFGVVLAEPPDGSLATPTLMDFRPVLGSSGPATFAYSLPVADGWLVEETVLAARPAVDPDALVTRLACRLDTSAAAMLDSAVRTESVRIPMGGGRPRHGDPVVAFGAAAGYVNPTSGYSVVRSLQTAPAVAAAIRDALAAAPAGRVASVGGVWDAVWPRSARRVRVLHDYGLDVLVGLDAPAVRAFFESFFALPTESWSAYMRSDSSPADVAGVMRRMFSTAPWSTRRRLVAGNPLALARLVRPG